MVINPNTNEPDNLLKADQLRTYFSASNTTIKRWITKGLLPEPQYLNGIRVWRQSDIDKAEEHLLTSDKPEQKNEQAYTA